MGRRNLLAVLVVVVVVVVVVGLMKRGFFVVSSALRKMVADAEDINGDGCRCDGMGCVDNERELARSLA